MPISLSDFLDKPSQFPRFVRAVFSRRLQELSDLCDRSSRPKNSSDSHFLKLGKVFFRNDPTQHNPYIMEAATSHFGEHRLHERQVGSVE